MILQASSASRVVSPVLFSSHPVLSADLLLTHCKHALLMPQAFNLVSSTRFDARFRDVAWNTEAHSGVPSPFLLLNYHRDRLLGAAKTHGWDVPRESLETRLEELCDAAVRHSGDNGELSLRIRILLSREGSLSVTASPTSSLLTYDPTTLSFWLPTSSPEPPVLVSYRLHVHLDTIPTSSSVFTHTKTTCRDHYTEARARFGIPPPPTPSLHEVLLFNDDGELTETSIRNIAFVRRDPPCWVTPPATTGCLPGVMRRWLLEQGRVIEAEPGELMREKVVDGE
ncbi:aminotransferase class IV-domain-containing protein [Trametes meyenii]|nr:aminotransferase class IV-domain-containing protein [Trametes meyenii]